MSKSSKQIIALILAVVAISFAFPAFAQYTPMVRIPGLPATGSISLSMYLVGLYNFLVSIVGIVAVMMMIVGGMRYITAGGSSSAIGDAKDIISNAVAGLVIAIFAWVIVAAINPDVLYIKKPGLSAVSSVNLYSCVQTFVASTTCICSDGATVAAAATEAECNNNCKAGSHCLGGSNNCIRDGVDDTKSIKFTSYPNFGKCLCADGKNVIPVLPATCQATCLPNNCFVIAPKVGEMPMSLVEMGVAGYTSEQIRSLALKDPGSDINPLTLPEGASFVMDLDKSIVPTPPATYMYDNNGDGTCDIAFNGTVGEPGIPPPVPLGGNWAVFTMYKSLVLPPVCKLTLTPNGERCVAKICGTDSGGHTTTYDFHSITLYK